MTTLQTTILTSLLRADSTVQWRNRRSPVLASFLAIVMLTSLKTTAQQGSGSHWQPILLSVSLSIVLMGMGLIGYTTTVARDRDRGVFKRLCATPASRWMIMASRLIVQLAVMAILVCFILVIAAVLHHIRLTPLHYGETIVTSLLDGLLYLGIGQTMVGLLASSETVSSVGRVLYFSLALGGSVFALGVLSPTLTNIVHWSPYGTAQSILASAATGVWNGHAVLALLLTGCYAAFFLILGISRFKWVSKD